MLAPQRRAHFLHCAATTLLFLAFSSVESTAQIALDQAAQKLAGGTSLAWRLDQISQFMGADGKCTGDGEIDRFFADHKLQIVKCTDGNLVKTDHTWSLKQSGPLDIILRIDTKERLLLFHDEGSAHYMRLRERPEDKSMLTQDRDFRLSDD